MFPDALLPGTPCTCIFSHLVHFKFSFPLRGLSLLVFAIVSIPLPFSSWSATTSEVKHKQGNQKCPCDYYFLGFDKTLKTTWERNAVSHDLYLHKCSDPVSSFFYFSKTGIYCELICDPVTPGSKGRGTISPLYSS